MFINNKSMNIEEKINNFLKELFYENWMNENDWGMFLEELEIKSKISIESLSKDIQEGINNGYSIDNQFDTIKNLLKNGKSN
jgi:hypothetical protein